MFLDAESAILAAVRDTLIDELEIRSADIGIEIDDLAPAIAGERYYALSAQGSAPARHEEQADKVFHYRFGVRVALIERITETPRDRRGEVYANRVNSLNSRLSLVSKTLRFSYDLLTRANQLITTSGLSGKFIKPLVPTSVDTKPVIVGGDIFAAKSKGRGDAMMAMKRGINFTNAEFIGRYDE